MFNNLVKSKKGMTLVEVILGLAIFAILSIFIASVFVSSLKIIKNNSDWKKGAKNAAGGIEETDAGIENDKNISIINKTEGTFEITFGEENIKTEGEYISGTDKNQDAKYNYFSPK